jgi:hypothetical protein
MDISRTTEAKSDQQNFDDYLGGPKTVTVTEVKPGSAEQPVEIHLAEFPGKPYKPSKSMRRVLVACWGSDAALYAGRRITLYGDPTIRFGKDVVGGIRIGALSHLEKPVTVSLTVSRGKRAPFVVKPLVEAQKPTKPAPSAPAWTDEVAAADDMAALSEIHARAVAEEWVGPELLAALTARKNELGNA